MESKYEEKVLLQTVAEESMAIFAFDVLCSALQESNPPQEPDFSNEAYPLFVTWTIGEERKLRGCIGTFRKTELQKGVRDYALISGLEDDRFGSIKPEEIPDLHVCVSILYNFEEGGDYLDWEIGLHGVKITFTDEDGMTQVSTYLPEVPRLQGWNKVKTIDKLLKKGGWKGGITPSLRDSVKLERYRTERATLDYSDYLYHIKNRHEG